jgi:hypothetical protein
MKKLRPAGRRSSQQPSPRTRLAADIGGTFTDIAAFDVALDGEGRVDSAATRLLRRGPAPG